ncbi:MAG: MBL fold metallo-hydrolase [Candidatus Bathyarchaeota archaeon]|nr:MBL fold metallo-hydrolase [Candidatus Bathyarchaeota archaeon]
MTVDKVPGKNSVIFVCLNNYAGVLLKTPTKTLLIDPVDVKPKSFPQLDAVLITHEHYDHLDQRLIAELQKNTDCKVIADQTSAKKLSLLLPPDKLFETRVGDETDLGEVKIKTENCKHQASTPVTYIITSEDGMKIWHTADSLPFPEMAQIGKTEELDVVFCTVGIAPGTSPETGSQIAWLTKPKVAVPYHSNSVEPQKKFAQILKAELPKTTCVIPEINKVYQVSKGEKKT